MKCLFLWPKNSVKELTINLKKTGGRNNFGNITIFHRGRGCSKRYRLVYYFQVPFQNKYSLFIIRRFEYDPNRKTFLALVCSEAGYLLYILAVENMYIGQILEFNNTTLLNLNFGNRTCLRNFSLGSFLNNIESNNNRFSIFSRAAGTSSILLKKYNKNVLIKLNSNFLKLFNENCLASYGTVVSNFTFFKYKKAGQMIWLNKKPKVRGVAMNPIDHPHGGGEGKTSGGRCSVSPWGILTKGFPTVRGKRRKLKSFLNNLI